jgi:outer membrane protein OmpU
MNKLTNFGVSALWGCLASFSAANAADLGVTGSVHMTWLSLDDETTGNPIGINSGLTFAGSGEMDNGWTVDLSIAHADKNAYSNTNITVGIPGLGDLRIDQGTSGTGIDRMDDKTPSVWEEAYGWGLASGIVNASGTAAGAGVEFTPSGTPDGLTARIAFSPSAGGSNSSEKGSSGDDASVAKSGWDITLEASSDLLGVDGLSVYGGIAQVEQHQNAAAYDGDKEDRVLGATYAAGSFSFGYQWSRIDLGRATGATEYSNAGYGITFNVNDDLSLGYNHYESEQSNSTNNTAEATSFQIAYTMGGATLSIADGSIDNKNYSTAATSQRDATVISVQLAF